MAGPISGWDADGDVDLADFTGFQKCGSTSSPESIIAFDTSDRISIGTHLTGAQAEVDTLMMAISGELDSALLATGPDEAEIPSDGAGTSTEVLHLELRPLGGGDPIDVVEPFTTYEVHYSTNLPAASLLLLTVLGSSPDDALLAATVPEVGPWAEPTSFLFVDLAAGGGYPESPYGSEILQLQLVLSDFAGTSDEGGASEGVAFLLTTGTETDLALNVLVSWLNESGLQVGSAETTVAWPRAD